MDLRTSHFVPAPGQQVLFLTGRLAEGIVRRVVADVSKQMGFLADVHVLGISVAALMHVDWLKRKLDIDLSPYDHIYLPGWCQGDLAILRDTFSKPFSRGPKEITDLSEFFGRVATSPPDLSNYDIEILAEINHAPRMSDSEILNMAESYRTRSADLIDLGCVPGESWPRTGHVVSMLKDQGFRVSIDSFDRFEVEQAVAAGAELILSCNSQNVDWLADLGTDVVIIPDHPHELESMWETAKRLEERNCLYRLDPILEPVGFGFAASLSRYFETRRLAPDTPIMMGIGNITEMSEVDSAGINFLLAAICQELNIKSVLTTQVIPWCQHAVKEFDIARRMVRHAITNHSLAKRICPDLVMLHDTRISSLDKQSLLELSENLRDPSFRIFVEGGQIHIMNRDGYWTGEDPFNLFDQILPISPQVDASHAFYLGYELSKAVTALTLGKRYQQDHALQWGFLTIPEMSAIERRHAMRQPPGVNDE